jgi:glycosyltransferase involved in cell wall biosynthesis
MNYLAGVHVSHRSGLSDERSSISGLLDSLLAQDWCGMEWEAIFADGMSDDGTREVLEQYAATHPDSGCCRKTGRLSQPV